MKRKKRQKLLPKKTQNTPFYRRLTQPVPLDVWRACMTAWQAAAEFKMPDVDPSAYKIGVEGQVYAFANNPMNRGIVAVKEFLGQDQADLLPTVCNRLMALNVIWEMRSDDRFSGFFKGDAPDGGLLVDEVLLDACAKAAFVPRTLELDLDSVLAAAKELALEAC